MARTTIRLDSQNPRLQEALMTRAEALGDLVLADLRLATPVDTGRLRDSWEIRMNDDGFTITNAEDYATSIDDGSSSQAPAGIVDPVLAKYNLRRT